MSLPNAFVTLLTTSSYLPGALVLLHSLLALHPGPRDFKTVCFVTPETVDARTIGELRKAGYDFVIGVEPIGSGVPGQQGLELMGRPDLNLALTKLHIFRLAPLFSTIIYLDADTLPLRPLSHLFTTTAPHVLSACPDIGWPDCFNSGVMVIRPRESDFLALRQMLKDGAEEGELYKGNGSFDGADQGLLNEYFSPEGAGGDWNRLPFTYNTTPTAAYQYAPAYKRYGHRINVVHFIGPHKPWSNLSSRPAGISTPKGKEQAYDYPALIDRWYAIYDSYVRPTAAHAPDVSQRFAVPETVAVWNLASGVPQQPEDRLDLTDLKSATERGVTALKPGQYMSLPLEGRVDLIMPKPQPLQKTVSPPKSPSAQDAPPLSSAPPPQEVQQQVEQPKTWDAAHFAPPPGLGPEMAIPMNTFYQPAWEQPTHTHSTYFAAPQPHQEPQYPTLPSSVTSDAWYKDYTGLVPDRANVQPVFPWEKQQSRQPARVFPRGDTPPPQAQPQSLRAPHITLREATPDIQTPPRATAASSSTPSPPPQLSFAESMASYTNAWDDMPGIARYATRLTRLGIGSQFPQPPPVRPTAPSTPVLAAPRPRREPSLDNRSEGSRDGDDEGDAGDDSDDGSPSGRSRESSSGYNNARYRDRQAQTDRVELSDAKVQAVPGGGGPSPAIRTIELPSSAGFQPRRKVSFGHSAQQVSAVARPPPPPAQSQGQGRGGGSAQSSRRSSVESKHVMTPPSPSVATHQRRTSASSAAAAGFAFTPASSGTFAPVKQQVQPTSLNLGYASGGSGAVPPNSVPFPGSTRRGSGSGSGTGYGLGMTSMTSTATSPTPPQSSVFNSLAAVGPSGPGSNEDPSLARHLASNAGRSWDPNTDIDVRRRDTQQVLNRFMQVGMGGGAQR